MNIKQSINKRQNQSINKRIMSRPVNRGITENMDASMNDTSPYFRYAVGTCCIYLLILLSIGHELLQKELVCGGGAFGLDWSAAQSHTLELELKSRVPEKLVAQSLTGIPGQGDVRGRIVLDVQVPAGRVALLRLLGSAGSQCLQKNAKNSLHWRKSLR